jgi:esterase/lipase superfamily enzyme
MHREYFRWHSAALGRDMELLVLGHTGARVLVFPTRCGRFYDYENFGLVDDIQERVRHGGLQLFCLDSIDTESFYASWRPPHERIARHQQYEDYLLREVIPFSLKRNPHHPLMTHGCSLGAYHALNLAFRHPDLFVKAVGLSGRYDLTIPIGDFGPLLDGYFDTQVYYHMPSQYVPNMADPALLERLRRLHIVFAVGEADPFVENNRHLSNHLWAKGVGHEFFVWKGRAHRPERWKQMVAMYL